jgi:hypothetical protein
MEYDTSVVDTLYSCRGNAEFLKTLAFTFFTPLVCGALVATLLL